MKKNYIKCNQCAYRVEQPDYDPHEELCRSCNNSRLVIDPKDILCNMCGGGMCDIPHEPDNQVPYGMHNHKEVGSYSSPHLTDTTTYTFSLCELCLRNMFNHFKIPPTMGSYMHMPIPTWQEDQEYYEERMWRESNEPHDAYMAGKCNAVKNCTHNAKYSVYFDNEFSEKCVCETHKSHYDSWSGANLKRFTQDDLKPFL